MFDKASALMEKAQAGYEKKQAAKSAADPYTDEDKATYKNSLTALKDAYTILGKDDKYKEVKAKLEALQ
jgi:hypothetical protein